MSIPPERIPDDYIEIDGQKMSDGNPLFYGLRIPGWKIGKEWFYFYYFDDGQEFMVSSKDNNKNDVRSQLILDFFKIKADRSKMDRYQKKGKLII